MNNNLQQIPFELLELIITHVTDKKHLLQCTLVNSLFYTVASPKLWQSPILYEGSIRHTAAPVLKILTLASSYPHLHPVPLGSYIRKLSFCCMYDPRSGNSLGESPCDLISLLEWTPKVEEVTLEGNELYNKDMDSIARHCPHITTLTLVNMYNITDDALKQFGYLSSLTLKNCRRLTNRALLNVKNCSHITTFTLVKMHKITDDALELFDHLSSLTLKECIQLTSHAILNVKHCPLVSLCLEGDLQSIEVLFGQTLSSLSLTTYYHRQLTIPPIQDSLLKKLCLDGFGSKETPINGIILQRFVEAHSQLEVLELRWCKVKYDLVAWNLKNLRRLYLDCRWGLPIVWLEKMIVACPRLVYIHSDFPAKFTWEQDDISKVRLGIAPLTYNNCLPVSSGLV